MSIFSRKQKISCEDLAKTLLDDFINNEDMDSDPDLEIPSGLESKFHAKLRLFRLALVMTMLMGEEKRNSQFIKIRSELEAVVLPASYEEGQHFLSEIQSAKKDLGELFLPHGKRKEMTWAMSWLRDIGVEESNPATLALFALKWMYLCEAIGKFLGGVRPV